MTLFVVLTPRANFDLVNAHMAVSKMPRVRFFWKINTNATCICKMQKKGMKNWSTWASSSSAFSPTSSPNSSTAPPPPPSNHHHNTINNNHRTTNFKIHTWHLYLFLKKCTRGILLTAMCALTKSKMVRGAKTAKRTVLRGAGLYFILLMGQNRNFLILWGPKLLLSLNIMNICNYMFSMS